jgi:hypothetical protein
MQVTATLKFVLRDLPETQERDGMIAMTLHNEPRGLLLIVTINVVFPT